MLEQELEQVPYSVTLEGRIEASKVPEMIMILGEVTTLQSIEFRVGGHTQANAVIKETSEKLMSRYIDILGPEAGLPAYTVVVTRHNFRRFVEEQFRNQYGYVIAPESARTVAGNAWNVFMRDKQIEDYATAQGVTWRVANTEAVTLDGLLFLFGFEKRALEILNKRKHGSHPKSRKPWFQLADYLLKHLSNTE